MTTTTTDPYPHIPLPAGAVTAEWQDPGTSGVYRYFEGSHWVVGPSEDPRQSQGGEVYVRGCQELDGTVEREIAVYELHPDRCVTAQQARQLAEALVAAADEVERWTR